MTEQNTSKSETQDNVSTQVSIEELLRPMLSGIDSAILRSKLLSLVGGERLGSPVTRNVLRKKAKELLNALKRGDASENPGN